MASEMRIACFQVGGLLPHDAPLLPGGDPALRREQLGSCCQPNSLRATGYPDANWLRLKKNGTKMGSPGKWKHGPKPA